MPDPAVRRDGTCRVCKGERPQIARDEKDPFCSSECCKTYFGVEMNSSTSRTRIRKRPRLARDGSMKRKS